MKGRRATRHAYQIRPNSARGRSLRVLAKTRNPLTNCSRLLAHARLIRTPCSISERSTANADDGMTTTPRALAFAANEALIPHEADEVPRLIVDDHSAEAFHR